MQIFLAGVRQRSEQFHELAAGESGVAHRDDLADWFASSLHDESLVRYRTRFTTSEKRRAASVAEISDFMII